jgi:PEP-CTERM motif
MPDDISGEVTLVARCSLTPAFYPFGPSAAGGYLSVRIEGVGAQALSAPIPEPASYALMIAGLALVGIVAKRSATSQRGLVAPGV